MARGVNKVILIGNLGKDPETRYLGDGSAVTNFSIAVSESFKDKATGEMKEVTEWVPIETWGRTAEVCAEYLTKGKAVYVEGKYKTDSWDDKTTGEKKYRTKVRAHDVHFLSGGERTERPAAPKSPAQQQEFEDDIPF